MAKNCTLEYFAKKTFLALKNPYKTVLKVYPNIIDDVSTSLEKSGYACYTGYKETEAIPESLMERFHKNGFLKHTKDWMAFGGRAVDLKLVNPLTGRWMTGSSSGTALNVFYGINDLGVGTDGGGSVLAPAAALNLFGFISPEIEGDYVRQFVKKSTDGIVFSPSIGFITRDLKTMRAAVCMGTDFYKEENTKSQNKGSYEDIDFINVTPEIDIYGSRERIISYVKNTVKKGTALISSEGPVDVLGMGDSVFGHFDKDTMERQKLGRKGLMRVANMCGLSALTVPAKELGRCTVYLCSSNLNDIQAVFNHAESICTVRSLLIERYFLNLNMYF